MGLSERLSMEKVSGSKLCIDLIIQNDTGLKGGSTVPALEGYEAARFTAH